MHIPYIYLLYKRGLDRRFKSFYFFTNNISGRNFNNSKYNR